MRVEKTDEYAQWIDALKDRAGRARILMRVERLIEGNPGQHRALTDGVAELKVDFGPGYRVYYTQRGTRLLLLLAGGDKSTQQKDIQLAINWPRIFRSSSPCQEPLQRRCQEPRQRRMTLQNIFAPQKRWPPILTRG